jgi:Na+/H+-translocating membrane pyrophosphatase
MPIVCYACTHRCNCFCAACALQEVARSTETGAATNIIYGLALGYKSAIIPVTVLAVAILVSFKLIGMCVWQQCCLPLARGT